MIVWEKDSPASVEIVRVPEPLEVAALVDAVLSDDSLYDAIVTKQDEALARLRAKDFGGTLLGFVDQVLKSPRKPAPQIAWDFWDQLKLAEELYELQQYRPAIYRGLPDNPERPAASSQSQDL